MTNITELQNYSLEEFFGIYALDEVPKTNEFDTIDNTINLNKEFIKSVVVQKTKDDYENMKEKENEAY